MELGTCQTGEQIRQGVYGSVDAAVPMVEESRQIGKSDNSGETGDPFWELRKPEVNQVKNAFIKGLFSWDFLVDKKTRCI